MKKILTTIVLLWAMLGCRTLPEIPVHMSLVVDLSSSTKYVESPKDIVKHAADEWLSQRLLIPGSTFNVFVVGGHDNKWTWRYSAIVRKRWGPNVAAQKYQFRQQVLHEVDSLDFSRDCTNCSAILETMSDAAEHLHSQFRITPGRMLMLVLSDLREIAVENPALEFESITPNVDSVLSYALQKNLLNFRGIEVIVYGFHRDDSPDVPGSIPMERLNAIKTVWEAIAIAGRMARFEIHPPITNLSTSVAHLDTPVPFPLPSRGAELNPNESLESESTGNSSSNSKLSRVIPVIDGVIREAPAPMETFQDSIQEKLRVLRLQMLNQAREAKTMSVVK